MTFLIVALLIPALYAAIALLTARHVYGRIRASEIAQWGADKFDGEAAMMNGFAALFAGVFWPLALIVLVVIYKPVKAPEELKAERDAMAKRIRDLETDLGIRDAR